MHYKRDKDNQIILGPWAMIEIVVRIAKHISPTMIGFRIPIVLILIPFLRALKDVGHHTMPLTLEKLGLNFSSFYQFKRTIKSRLDIAKINSKQPDSFLLGLTSLNFF